MLGRAQPNHPLFVSFPVIGISIRIGIGIVIVIGISIIIGISMCTGIGIRPANSGGTRELSSQ